MNTEDIIIQRVKELIGSDLKHLKYTDIPHILLVVTKLVYEYKTLGPSLEKDLIVKIAELLVDDSDMSYTEKIMVKSMIPHLVDKYIEIDDGSMKIKIKTYGHIGRIWIKIRTYLDRKILKI